MTMMGLFVLTDCFAGISKVVKLVRMAKVTRSLVIYFIVFIMVFILVPAKMISCCVLIESV